MPKDNAGLPNKVAVRARALERLSDRPIILETHAGEGVVYDRLYRAACGACLERDETKSYRLATQRPTWRVYQVDAIAALRAGLEADTPFSLVDIDPYGDPWPTIRAYMAAHREFPARFMIAVNDGLRRNIKMGTAWKIASLRDAVRHFGTDIHDQYLAVSRWMLEREANDANLSVARFEGFHAGANKQMTHWLAELCHG